MSNTSFPTTGSSNWDKAQPNGPIRWQLGPDQITPYIVQTFLCRMEDWQPLTMSTPYSAKNVSMPNYYLVHQSNPVDIGGGIVAWERTYAPIFPDYESFEQYAHRYPGVVTGSGGIFARPAQTIVTHSVLRSKFFLLGVSYQDVYPYGLVTDYFDIPMLAPLPIITAAGWAEDYSSSAINGTLNHPEHFPDNTTGDENGTSRTDDEYFALVTADAWVVSQESVITQQWPGSGLYERVTRYVKAQ